MLLIKVQCPCGQRYAFDVQPIQGRMPGPVSCPVCGVDGTGLANEILVRNLAASPPQAPRAVHATAAVHAVAPAAASPSVAVAANPPAPSEPVRSPAKRAGQLEPAQAEHEARAKIMWGDEAEGVIKFLLIQGIDRTEASNIVGRLLLERAATIRANGMKKIVTAIGLICVPVVAFFVFIRLVIFPLKLFAMTLMLGCWGFARLVQGLFMFFTPKSEAGDVSEQ